MRLIFGCPSVRRWILVAGYWVLDAGSWIDTDTLYETTPKWHSFFFDQTGRNSEQIERRTSNVQHRTLNIDGFVKSPKTANFQFSHLVNSIGYEIDIQEF